MKQEPGSSRRPVTAVRLKPATREQLDALAFQSDLSISWLVNKACEAYLDRKGQDLP